MELRRCASLLTLILTILVPLGANAVAEVVRLHVHVTRERDGLALGGAYLRLTCPQASVDISGRTAVDGWGILEFGYAATPVDLPSAGPLRLLPSPRPNPVHGEAMVPFVKPAGKAADDGDLTLYDLRGRALAHGRLGSGGLDLPGDGAPAGVYLLRCVDRATGTRSDCRIVATGTPLRRLRFAPGMAAAARRDPPSTFPSALTVRYPGELDRESPSTCCPATRNSRSP